MSKAQGFEDLVVWQKAVELVVKVYEVCRGGSLSEDWALRDQMQRAAISVPANIAEGYERGSRREYVQFLVIAKGSAGELRCLLRIAERLRCVDGTPAGQLVERAIEISRILAAMIISLRKPA